MYRASLFGSAELNGEESGNTATTPIKNPNKYKDHRPSKLPMTLFFKRYPERIATGCNASLAGAH